MKILLHTCCAPCSTYVIDKLRKDGYEDITSYWYNINIHPYEEYRARLNALIDYTKMVDVPLIIDDDYGIRKFTKSVINDIDGRCRFCYVSRLAKTVKYAKENGYDAFTSTLFVSIYQNHELMKQICESLAEKYDIKFLYRDFRVGFREGQNEARSLGMYMQKYCGCIFSEEDRYQKQIEKDKQRN